MSLKFPVPTDIPPANAQLVLDRLVTSSGWLASKRFSAQREVIGWLAARRYIDCKVVYPTGYLYRINCPKVKTHIMPFKDTPVPGMYVGMLRKAKRFFQQSPGGRLTFGFDGSRTREEWQRETWRALDRRINARGGLTECRGRRDTEDYHIQAWRDSRRIREHFLIRMRVYEFETHEARNRFGHILASNN